MLRKRHSQPILSFICLLCGALPEQNIATTCRNFPDQKVPTDGKYSLLTESCVGPSTLRRSGLSLYMQMQATHTRGWHIKIKHFTIVLYNVHITHSQKTNVTTYSAYKLIVKWVARTEKLLLRFISPLLTIFSSMKPYLSKYPYIRRRPFFGHPVVLS